MKRFTTWLRHFHQWEVYVEHQKRRKQLVRALVMIFLGSVSIGLIGGFVYTDHERQNIISIAKEIENSETTQMDQLVEQLKESK